MNNNLEIRPSVAIKQDRQSLESSLFYTKPNTDQTGVSNQILPSFTSRWVESFNFFHPSDRVTLKRLHLITLTQSLCKLTTRSVTSWEKIKHDVEDENDE